MRIALIYLLLTNNYLQRDTTQRHVFKIIVPHALVTFPCQHERRLLVSFSSSFCICLSTLNKEPVVNSFSFSHKILLNPLKFVCVSCCYVSLISPCTFTNLQLWRNIGKEFKKKMLLVLCKLKISQLLVFPMFLLSYTTFLVSSGISSSHNNSRIYYSRINRHF